MTRVRRLCAAAAMAALVAGVMVFGTAPAEAAKKGGGDDLAAKCEYLRSVINYQNVSPYIKLWAIALYNDLGCQPALP